MATLGDVARASDVSISTVSRILSNDPRGRASDETRARVLSAAERLRYRPNFAGRALKASRTFALALIVPDLTNAIFTELMRGVEEEALDRGYVVLLARSESMQPGAGGIERLLEENRVDGVLLQLGDGVSPEAVSSLVADESPLVLINSPPFSGAGTISLPDGSAARSAVDHLVSLGHRRVGLLTGAAASSTARERESGFRAAMAAHGLPVSEEHVLRSGYAPADGDRGMRELLASEHPPTAVVVANVNAALGALSAAHSLGVAVPDELSLVSIHDAWTAATSWPPLTTVRMPLFEMGRRAVAMLDARIAGASVENWTMTEEPVLEVRESTAAAR